MTTYTNVSALFGMIILTSLLFFVLYILFKRIKNKGVADD